MISLTSTSQLISINAAAGEQETNLLRKKGRWRRVCCYFRCRSRTKLVFLLAATAVSILGIIRTREAMIQQGMIARGQVRHRLDPKIPVRSGQLTAAEIDDNLNYDSFNHLKKSLEFDMRATGAPMPITGDTSFVEVIDSTGNPFSCAVVTVANEHKKLELRAGTDGRVAVFPGVLGSWNVSARAPGGKCPDDCSKVASIDITRKASIVIEIPAVASTPSKMDLAFVLDTTASMCGELEYLKMDLKAVLSSIVADVSKRTDVRVGVITYKDPDVTTTAFTTPEDAIAVLMRARCGGGGDVREAMGEALEAAASLEWRGGNVARTLILAADAPPKFGDDRKWRSFLDLSKQLRRLGVRAYGLMAGGGAVNVEYLMRLMGVVTGSRYAWLTDDGGVGDPHYEPHVPCYQATRLDNLLTRLIRSELQGRRVEAEPKEIVREVGVQENGTCTEWREEWRGEDGWRSEKDVNKKLDNIQELDNKRISGWWDNNWFGGWWN